jgi:hypothetical protein
MWYAAGAYRRPDGSTAPALWTSPDAEHWRPVPARPVSAYGPSHLLYAVACRGDTVVAIGSAAGGVHGNPRTATWRATGAGPLVETPAAFELYGGPRAIGVGQLVAGPAGWLITGARLDANGRPGAAVWVAPDGLDFHLVDADPELESDARGQTVAVGGYAGPDGFTVAGSVGRTTRTPVVWTSPDGQHWRRTTLPTDAADAELQAIAPGGDAAGIAGTGFASWHRDAAGWRQTGRFGRFAGTGLPQVLDLRAGVALVADGQRYRLWRDGGQLALPIPLDAGGGRHVALAADGSRLLLAADDGTVTRLWTG